MKIIDKKQFFPTVCVVYTLLSIMKILVEYVARDEFGAFQENLLVMLFLSFLATFVLSQHYRFEKLPLLLVIVLQYVFLIAAVMLFTWISGFFSELHPNAYRDIFRSFTVPYLIGAVVYYVELYFEVRKADRLLQEYKKKE